MGEITKRKQNKIIALNSSISEIVRILNIYYGDVDYRFRVEQILGSKAERRASRGGPLGRGGRRIREIWMATGHLD